MSPQSPQSPGTTRAGLTCSPARDAISYDQVATDLSAATGQPIGYADNPPEAAGPALLESGLPPFAAEQIVAVFGELRRGVQAETTDTVRALTGRTPRSFADFARDYASVFRSSGVPVGG